MLLLGFRFYFNYFYIINRVCNADTLYQLWARCPFAICHTPKLYKIVVC